MTTSSSDFRVLAIPQPPSGGQSPLVCTPGRDNSRRLSRTPNYPANHPSRVFSGSVEEVLDLMKDTGWVHFTCHGAQDSESPTDSGLCLTDQRRLELSDVIALSHPSHGPAFPSACQTAMATGICQTRGARPYCRTSSFPDRRRITRLSGGRRSAARCCGTSWRMLGLVCRMASVYPCRSLNGSV